MAQSPTDSTDATQSTPTAGETDDSHDVTLSYAAWIGALVGCHQLRRATDFGDDREDQLLSKSAGEVADDVHRALTKVEKGGIAEDQQVTVEIPERDVGALFGALGTAHSEARNDGDSERAMTLRNAIVRVEEQTGLRPTGDRSL